MSQARTSGVCALCCELVHMSSNSSGNYLLRRPERACARSEGRGSLGTGGICNGFAATRSMHNSILFFPPGTDTDRRMAREGCFWGSEGRVEQKTEKEERLAWGRLKSGPGGEVG
nr:hypothetical protein CFP56_03733 [Quercus suber]